MSESKFSPRLVVPVVGWIAKVSGFSALLAALAAPTLALAEGSAEFDAFDNAAVHDPHDQAVNSATALRVDINENSGRETICFRGRGSLAVARPDGTSVGTANDGGCMDTVSGVTGAYRLTLTLDQSLGREWDIRVCALTDRANCLSNDALERTGRLWSARWIFQQNASFNRRYSVNGSVYAIVPGGGAGRDAVIEMQMRGVSGAYYDLLANSQGTETDAGVRVGRSAPQSGHIAPAEFPLYLNPPAVAQYNWLAPQVSNVVLNTSCGDVLVQDGADGTVTFESNVDGQFVLICDVNEDGVYDFGSDADFSSFGTASVGTNTAVWGGKANDGSAAAEGSYNCVVRLNVGEYHYVARDIETAYPGIRMYRVEADKTTRTGVNMYWDDRLTPGDDRDMDGQAGQISPITSPPNGLAPGAYNTVPLPFYYTGATENGNARAWGDFSAGSKGDNAFLDQFSAADTMQSAPFSVQVLSSTGDADSDGLTNTRECTLASNPYDPDTDGDGVDDGFEATQTSAPNTDGDGLIDILDNDDDGDGILTAIELGGSENGDGDPSDAANTDGTDAPDYLDTDSDNDGVPDGLDVARTDPNACRDTDNDNCDDCVLTGADGSGGDPNNDGTDTDGDQICNLTDVDDDGDGVCDAAAAVMGVCSAGPDTDPLSATACADSDGDGCDDCSGGAGPNPASDGLDSDGDGLCDVGDPDDDGDGVPDGDDVQPLNPARCADSDSDTCDDCAVANSAQPANDGLDSDGDGLCDVGDPDDDGDGVPDGGDVEPLNPARCADSDNDTCDDCAIASMPQPANDGADLDGDGLCDAGDPDVDGDGRCEGAQAVTGQCEAGPDSHPADPNLCGDTDMDGCDDCSMGSFDPSNDGLDADGDGQCNAPDTDGDGRCDGDAAIDGVCVAGPDSEPMDETRCGDTDGDGCDDCSSSTFDPAADGPDADGDGVCDRGDDFDGDGLSDYDDLDDDGDGILDTQETMLDIDPSLDADDDGVQNYADANDRGDGRANGCSDANRDGICDTLSTVFDSDGDGVPNHLDLDADGDTIGDADESGHSAPDVNRDGVVDGAVGDNGVADAVETSADSGNVAPPVDTDGDGTPDFLDADSDGDRAPDAREAGDMDRRTPPVDSDGDGLADYRDPDDDDDGIPTSDERTDSGADQDTDEDGTPDHLDPDDDGDGVPTVDELADDGSFLDSDGDELWDHLDDDDDGDGVPTRDERDGDSDRDTDGDSIPDYLDPDDDDDGVPTADERVDGTDPDTDGDGTPDRLDPDDDGDGIPTGEELGDADGDGTPDRLEPPLQGSLAGGALCAVGRVGGSQGGAFGLLVLLGCALTLRLTRRS